MALIILLFVISIPVIELSVLIDVGGEIGAFSTVLLCLLTAAVGLSIVRFQGMQVFANMQSASREGKPVGENLIHGFFLLIAGLFLLIPGFVTDTLGALLLIPPLRLLLGKAGLAHVVVRSSTHTSDTRRDNTVVDGEYWEEQSEKEDSHVQIITQHDFDKNPDKK